MNPINDDLDKLSENDTFGTTNPFYQLLEKQATEFELFGQRLKSELQNSYKEFIKLQQQQAQGSHDSQDNQRNMIEITKSREVFEKDSQSVLEDSLKARIEELETDSIIRNQDIERQKSEIQQLKQELNQFKNISDLNELKKMKQEIKELNDFKNNFTLLFNSFEQTKLEVKELKHKLQQNDIENDRLLAEQLQINEDNSNHLVPIDSGIIDGVSDVSSESSFDNGPNFVYPSNDPKPPSYSVSTPLPPSQMVYKNPPTHPAQINQASRPLPRAPVASPSQTGVRTINNFDSFAQINVRTSYIDPFDTSANSYTQNNIRTNHNENSFDTLRYPSGTSRVNKIKRTNTYSHFLGN